MPDALYKEIDVWWEDAACQSLDRELFFPRIEYEDGSEREPEYVPPAVKAICLKCPVQPECLNYALHVPLELPNSQKREWVQGVWGGTSTYQRDLMRRRQDRKSCPNCHSREIIDDRSDQICQSCGASWPASL